MSEAVERRLLDLLDHPTTSPYGNPIPGLDELGEAASTAGSASDEGLVTLSTAAASDPHRVVVRRIGEPLQTDAVLMASLRRAGVRPGEVVKVTTSAGGVLVGSGMEYAELEPDVAAHVFVSDITSPQPVEA
jgi:DtxR family Mn-dependent transcriptional regulator